MKYLQLFVILLANSFLVAAAAHPRDDPNGVCRFGNAAIIRVIMEGDNPEGLAAVIGGHLEYNAPLFDIFEWLMMHGRIRCIELCLSRINFPDAETRNGFLTFNLNRAMENNYREVTEFLLGQAFQIKRTGGDAFWTRPPWSQDEMRQLVERHPEHAAGLSPSPADFANTINVEEAMGLIDLIHFCYEINARSASPGTFNLTPLLSGLIGSGLGDEDMASVAERLLNLGARVEWCYLLELRHDYKWTRQIFYHYHEIQQHEVEVKEPEFA